MAPHMLADVHIDAATAGEALSETVLIRLNGVLGTSLGKDRAKSLLAVRDGKSFLDLIVEQVWHARATHGVRLPLIESRPAHAALRSEVADVTPSTRPATSRLWQ